MSDDLLPAIGFLVIACVLVAGYVAAVPVWRWRRSFNPDAHLLTPTDVWIWVLTSCPCVVLLFGIALPCGFGLVGLVSAGFAVNVNLDFSEYLRAELEDQYLLDVANEASQEQVRKTGSRRRRAQEWKVWTVYSYEQKLRSNASSQSAETDRQLQTVMELQTPLAYQIWELDIFYQAVDPDKGIFTEEALREIKDFEDRLVSFQGFESFCRRWHDRGASCDVPYSVKNLFFSVPDASAHNGSTMALVYDGSGMLGDIDAVLQELLRSEVRWWTDSDFNLKNLKSQYSRASIYGGAPLDGYINWDDRRDEQEAKITAWLGRLFEEFLRRADLTGADALPYKHVKFTWYERRINNYEILYYLRFDTLLALGTMATVALLVLARIQNLFITFFGAVGVALAFVGTYYFHFVVAGFKALTILDFVSLFVILGIAADDVLLLFNTYSIAPVLLGEKATPQQKMRWAYKEGTAPMLVTTVTTCGSFYANCFSIVTVVRSFGFFMATLVAWNFLNVLIIFPAAILVNDLYIIPGLTSTCRPCRRRHAGGADIPAPQESPQARAAGKAMWRANARAGVADVDDEDLRLVERVVAKRFWPCLDAARWLLILISVGAAGIFSYLAAVSFHVSEGSIEIFEEDLNLGRLEKLRNQVFPATSDEDFREAIRAAPPDRSFSVRSCPGRVGNGENASWCSARGICDTASSACTCEEQFVGEGCSVPRANGTLDLVYLSVSQDSEEYLYAHVLSSPQLEAAPVTLPPGRGDFFLRNEGDDDVDWQLDVVSVPGWLSFAPTAGRLQKRSFSRTDEVYAGRASFQANFDLAGRPAGWQGELDVSIMSALLPPRALRVRASVVRPPALAAMSAFADGQEAFLQPPFDVSRGFSTDVSENWIARNIEIRYQVSSPSDWLRVELEVLGADVVSVDGSPLRGSSIGVSAPGSIAIEVTSTYTGQMTTYILNTRRSCNGPCPTETSTTWTTTSVTSLTPGPGVSTTTLTRTSTLTQETDNVVGVMTLTALNCPGLQTTDGRRSLALGLAKIAEVEVVAVSVSVWCNGRRLSSGPRQLQVSPAELLYSMVVTGGETATGDVLRRLDLESSETMTKKLQASLDEQGLLVQLEILSLVEVQVNPDATSTATSSTGTATSSTRTATGTSRTATTTSSTATVSTSSTATATSNTSSSVTATSSSATSLTSTSISTTASSVTSLTSTQTKSTRTTTTASTSTSATFTSTLVTTTAAETTRTATTTTSSWTSTRTTTSTASGSTTSSSSFTSSTTTRSATKSLPRTTTTSTATSTESTSSTGTSLSSTTSVLHTSSSTVTATRTRTSSTTSVSSTHTTSQTSMSSTSATPTSVTATSTSSSTTSSASRTGTATTATQTLTTTSPTTTTTTSMSVSTSSSRSSSSTTFTATSSSITVVTSTHTSTTTRSHSTSTSTATITFADGYGYIYGEATLAECPFVGVEGLEALAKGISSVAQVEASFVVVQLCPQGELDLAGRRLQIATPRLAYGVNVPAERGPELFPRALASLQAATAVSIETALNSALADRGLAEELRVQSVSVSSGPPPTTRTSSTETSSTATGTTSTTTVLCPGDPVCAGVGSCIQRENGEWSCECLETFSGADCTERECPTCSNNASCLEGSQELDAIWQCDCVEPYYGERCEQKRCPRNCTDAGECDSTTGICSCFAGYVGNDCAMREVPLTNAIEIAIVFGLTGHKEDNRSAPAYDNSVDLLSPAAQAHMLQACSDARAAAQLLVKDELECWIESFAEYMSRVGGFFPVNDTAMVGEAFQAFMHQNVAVLNSFQKDVRTAGQDFAGKVMFSRLRVKVNMPVNAAKEQKDALRRRWQDFVQNLNTNAPEEAGQAIMVSWVWTSMALEESVFSSTVLAFSLSLCTSLVAVALFTRDLVLAFYVCLNILLVVCVLSGCLLNVLDYDFGVVEAIGATIFVGLSVDYCLHLAHGYHTATGRRAKVRVRNALVMLTPSILGGALTTIAGCAFLLPCRILLFRKLGWTLMLNAIIAITFTFSFLAPLLIIAGPGQRGAGPHGGTFEHERYGAESPTASFAAVTSRFVSNEVVPETVGKAVGKADEDRAAAAELRKSSASSPLAETHPPIMVAVGRPAWLSRPLDKE